MWGREMRRLLWRYYYKKETKYISEGKHKQTERRNILVDGSTWRKCKKLNEKCDVPTKLFLEKERE